MESTVTTAWIVYVAYTELEIIAHCLFEMTFAGFDEATIQSEWNEIIRASEELFRELREDDYLPNAGLFDYLRIRTIGAV